MMPLPFAIPMMITFGAVFFVIGFGKAYFAPRAKPVTVHYCYSTDQDETCRETHRQFVARGNKPWNPDDGVPAAPSAKP